MRHFNNLLGLLLILGAGYFIYQHDTERSAGDPAAAIDTTAVRQRLITIANSQWQYHAEHGAYATLEELASNNQLQGGPIQYGYHFVATSSATGFHITATPLDDADMTGWPIIEIDQTMRITER